MEIVKYRSDRTDKAVCDIQDSLQIQYISFRETKEETVCSFI